MREMIYKKLPETDVLAKGEYKGYSYVLVSYGTHPCAYVQLPEDHPLYGIPYDALDLYVHHRPLTYSGRTIMHNPRTRGWWLGWDYAQRGDYMGFYNGSRWRGIDELKKYTTEEIYSDAVYLMDQLEEVRLAHLQ